MIDWEALLRGIGIAVVVALGFHLFGCCTYGGKAVSRRDAKYMKSLGLDVRCPGDKECDTAECAAKEFDPNYGAGKKPSPLTETPTPAIPVSENE